MTSVRCFRPLFWLFALGLLLAVVSPRQLQAQCPMCKSNVEASLKTGEGGKGRGLNAGILFLLGTPYILGGGLAVYLYRKRRNSRKRQALAQVTAS